MKLAILDDEKHFTDIMSSFIAQFSKENKIEISLDVFNSSNEFLTAYMSIYDIIILDIKMNEPNGMEVAKRIRAFDKNVVILFITNMPQYALFGYEVNAVDYILKPLTYPEFSMKFKKALSHLLKNTKKIVSVNTTDGLINIPMSDIIYIEVDHNYLYYHTTSSIYKSRGTMKQACQFFHNYPFARIQSCYLVNMKHVTKITSQSVWVGEKELSLSRNKKNSFMEKYISYISRI